MKHPSMAVWVGKYIVVPVDAFQHKCSMVLRIPSRSTKNGAAAGYISWLPQRAAAQVDNDFNMGINLGTLSLSKHPQDMEAHAVVFSLSCEIHEPSS